MADIPTPDPPGKSTQVFVISLSEKVDLAREQENIHRSLTLFWQKERRRLERLIDEEYDDLREQINAIFGGQDDSHNRD